MGKKMTISKAKTASYKELRTFATSIGLRLQSPSTDDLRLAVMNYLTATPVVPKAPQPERSEKSHRNLGYEAKVALRVARFHPKAPDEQNLRDNVKLRFQLFKDLRSGMKVENPHSGEADCAVCGKHHIRDIYDVRLKDGRVIPLGDDCIENIGFIEGDGFFKARRDAAYLNRVEGAIADGSISKEEMRRWNIRKARGWTPEKLPKDLQ